ncbi:hypothetical protein TWF718_002841 [Orbilia javanica]|uniref:Uncharacterized protein n=1 Tax=Orbilia javanica TaxID=47235 RepID=A0AAN8NL11_9PEZI
MSETAAIAASAVTATTLATIGALFLRSRSSAAPPLKKRTMKITSSLCACLGGIGTLVGNLCTADSSGPDTVTCIIGGGLQVILFIYVMGSLFIKLVAEVMETLQDESPAADPAPTSSNFGGDAASSIAGSNRSTIYNILLPHLLPPSPPPLPL